MGETSTISERVKKMLTFLNLKPAQFARKLNYNRSQTIHDIIGGKANPSFDFFYRLENSEYSDIFRYKWIIAGKGEMLRNSENNQDVAVNIPKKVKDIQSQKLIPLYNGVINTKGIFNTEPSEYIDAGDWFRDATDAMRVNGDDMPQYPSGSIAVLKEVHDKSLLMYGHDYAIETQEYRTIHRIQKGTTKNTLLLCSDNDERWEDGSEKGRLIYEPFEVKIESIKRIFLVLGALTRNP